MKKEAVTGLDHINLPRFVLDDLETVMGIEGLVWRSMYEAVIDGMLKEMALVDNGEAYLSSTFCSRD
jgi:hypothetical protein